MHFYHPPCKSDVFAGFGKDLDRVCNEVFGAPILNGKKPRAYPLVDVARNEKSLLIQFSVPGVKLEDLTVEISRGEKLLSVSGKLSTDYTYKDTDYQIREFSSRGFSRTLVLPDDVLEDEPTATLKDGVLKLVFATKAAVESEFAIKKIKIQSE